MEDQGSRFRWWYVAIIVLIVALIIVILIVGSYHLGKRNGALEMTKSDAKVNNKFCSKGEAECRRVLEKYYGVKFPNVRPSWLKNPKTGRNLELDCYNEELKLAVEYDGEQHFKKTSMGNSKQLAELQERDKLKDRLCRANGVKLIRVSYKVKHEDIEGYLMKRIPSKPSSCNLL